MAHLSKKKIPEETYDKVKDELLTLLVQSGTHRKNILNELVTPTELLMLSKRLALISMLIDEHSYYQIQEKLGISTSTSKRFHRALLSDGYKAVEGFFSAKRKREEFWDTFEIILSAGMPSISGPRHTKYIKDKIRRKKQRS